MRLFPHPPTVVHFFLALYASAISLLALSSSLAESYIDARYSRAFVMRLGRPQMKTFFVKGLAEIDVRARDNPGGVDGKIDRYVATILPLEPKIQAGAQDRPFYS